MVSVALQLRTAWAVFQLTTPIVHMAALHLTTPKQARRPKLAWLAWPLAGGSKTLVFQVLSWTLFAVSMLLALAPRWSHHPADLTELDVLNAAAGFAATISLMFMIKSVLLFDPPTDNNFATRTESGKLRLRERLVAGGAAVQWDISRMPSRRAAFYIVVWLGVLWSGLGAALLLAANLMRGTMGSVYCVFAAMCFTIAATCTHGLGGHLRHCHHRTSSSPERHWKFYQPFHGGTTFIATQALGWMLFSSALAFALWGAVGSSLGIFRRVHSLCLAAGTSGIVAEVVLAASLLVYNASGEGRAGWPTQMELKTRRRRFSDVINHIAVMCTLYIQVHLLVAVFILSYMVLPFVFALSLWIGVFTVYYALTGFNKAELTGSREWPVFRDWVGIQAQRCLPAWLGNFEIVLDSEARQADFDPRKRKLIFGYVPHGLFPITAGYLPLTPAFKNLLPGVSPPTLTASISFQVPVIRDILMWCGLRIVSRQSFVRALRERGSVLVVPGGQAELVETQHMVKRHNPKCVLYGKHKGFIRLAIQEQASLVPVCCFGEATSLRNVVHMPRMQRWTYRRFGFPVPYLLVGKFGVLPLPARTGLRVVIGKPIDPPKSPLNVESMESLVDELHRQFYDEVEQIWMRHRSACPGFETMPLMTIR